MSCLPWARAVALALSASATAVSVAILTGFTSLADPRDSRGPHGFDSSYGLTNHSERGPDCRHERLSQLASTQMPVSRLTRFFIPTRPIGLKSTTQSHDHAH